MQNCLRTYIVYAKNNAYTTDISKIVCGIRLKKYLHVVVVLLLLLLLILILKILLLLLGIGSQLGQCLMSSLPAHPSVKYCHAMCVPTLHPLSFVPRNRRMYSWWGHGHQPFGGLIPKSQLTLTNPSRLPITSHPFLRLLPLSPSFQNSKSPYFAGIFFNSYFNWNC